MPTLVKDLMTVDVVTIDGAAPLLDAINLMIKKKVKSVVIPPRHDHDAFAIITFTDIAKKALAGDERVEMLNVYDIMTKPCVTVQPQWDIRYAARLLTSLNIHRAIVTEGNDLKGIISLTDLVKSLLDIAHDD